MIAHSSAFAAMGFSIVKNAVNMKENAGSDLRLFDS